MKKLSILLAVVLLAAAIGIGVLVNQKNKVNTDLATANTLVADTQKKLDEANAKVEEVGKELETAKVDLAAAMAATEAQGTELGGQLEAAKAEYEAAKGQLEQTNADLSKSLKDANAKALGLRLLLDNANKEKEAATVKSTELLGLVDVAASEKGQLTIDLENANAKVTELEAKVKELEAKVKELEAKVAELESAASQGQAQAEELTTKAGDLEAAEAAKKELEAKVAELETKVTDLETVKAEMDAKIIELEGTITANQAQAEELTTKAGDLEAAEAAKKELEGKVAELEGKVTELETQLAVPAEAPVVKHGLGMVTSIGSIADATAEKAGAAQVNTTVCSLVLDAEGKIQSVTWDVQQTKIQFSLEGKPVDLPAPEKLLTKLEKGPAYGMLKASAIGKEWFEQIAAFGAYCIGKTVDEVLSIPTFVKDENHQQVPDVEELKASVTVTVGDYLAALKKAADNAK